MRGADEPQFGRRSAGPLCGRPRLPRILSIVFAASLGVPTLAASLPAEAGPDPICLSAPTAACVFDIAVDLAQAMDPAEPELVKVIEAKGLGGDFAGAQETLELLVTRSPEYDDALRRLSAVAAFKGNTQQLELLLAAIGNLRVRELALRESAVAYAQGGHLDRAGDLLTQLALPEDRAAVLAEIGLSAQISGDADLAERSFEEAMASISQSQVAMSSIGIALAKAKRIDQALAVSQRLAPTTALYALQVSIVANLLEMNDVPRAMEVIKTIANPGIRKAARLRVLGFLVETGEDAAAENLLTTFSDSDQELTVRLAYARALARRGDDDAALAMVSNLKPAERSPVYYAIARRLIGEGDLAGAKPIIALVSNGRQRLDLQRLLALAEWGNGNAEDALAMALSIEPEAPRLAALTDLAEQMTQDR